VILFVVLSLLIKGFFSLWSQDYWLWWVKKVGALRISDEERLEVIEEISDKEKEKKPALNPEV